MQSLTIEISNQQDLQLIVQLAERLGLKWKKNPAPEAPETPLTPSEAYQKLVNSAPKLSDVEMEYHRKVIEAGGNMSDEKLQEWLEHIQESREEHPNPLRP